MESNAFAAVRSRLPMREPGLPISGSPWLGSVRRCPQKSAFSESSPIVDCAGFFAAERAARAPFFAPLS